MKKTLLALAVLGAFAGVASAQSSVTVYGRVDLSLAKNYGTEDKSIQNGSGSRLGFRGVEDLGGGMKAIFNVEHRFNADTGTDSSYTNLFTGTPPYAGDQANLNAAGNPTGRFWNGRSIVGLQTDFGQVVLGREYTPAFLYAQLIADPWGYDTVASGGVNRSATGVVNGAGVGGIAGITAGGIGRVRNSNAITYSISASGITFGAQIAEAEGNPSGSTNEVKDRPWGAALAYATGPFRAALAYENPSDSDDKWMTVSATYDFGMFKLGGLYGTGVNQVGIDHRSMLITGTAPIGAGELRLAYGTLKNQGGPATGSTLVRPGFTAIKAFAVGYHYSLSKRTTVYADYINNKRELLNSTNTAVLDMPGPKNGYDLGIKHNF